MGVMLDLRIQEWREEAGIAVPPPETCELWSKLQELAFEVIRIGELEKSGIRDGMGCWHGSDVIGGVLGELRGAIGHIFEAYEKEFEAYKKETRERAVKREGTSTGYGSRSDEIDDEIPF